MTVASPFSGRIFAERTEAQPPPGRFLRSADQAPWLDRVTDRLLDLQLLSTGWDGDRGLPANPKLVARAYEFLSAPVFHQMIEPAVVPLPDGSVQIEWHAPSVDVEIEVSPGDPALYVWIDSPDGEREFEGDPKLGASIFGEAIRMMAVGESS